MIKHTHIFNKIICLIRVIMDSEKGHSTEYAALELIDRILQHLDNNKFPINFYLDLSKAFYTIDHKIFLHKLQFYEIHGKTLSIFKIYLSNRIQFVVYEDYKSNRLTITTGVPQGLVLGPLSFLIYINDIANASHLFDFICFNLLMTQHFLVSSIILAHLAKMN